ncbi:MAG: hypothetical protein AAF214_07380 [Pseudomonadota bacterium]
MPFATAPMRRSRLLKTLAAERASSSPSERAANPGADAFVHDTSHWVSLWYDQDNACPSDFGTMTAYRAITVQGDLIWYVVFENGASVYHALCDDPREAITQASEAQSAQRQLMDQWHSVQAIARDLLAGRQKFDVTLDDAHIAPMCPLGFRAVMASAGLFGFKRISGKTAARLMKAEPQMGFVIYAAWMRARAQTGMAGPRDPVGFEAMC